MLIDPRTGNTPANFPSKLNKYITTSLDLTWHGMHNGGQGFERDRDVYVWMPIAKEVKEWEYELYFCSSKCLRSFLNRCVDEFERSINQARNEARTWPSRRKRPRNAG